jgi:glycosyltransferase involved in cell wall biosynthesis
VVDDASDDDTLRVLGELEPRMAITSIRNPTRLGFGGALRVGINHATTKWVAFTDADGQYDPHDLPRLMSALSAGADLSLGLRSPRADSFLRKTISIGFRGLVYLFFNLRMKDPTTSLRAGRTEQIRGVARQAQFMNGSFWNEFMIRWTRAGFSFVEVPVRHYRRHAGQSKVAAGAQIARTSVQHFIALLRIWRELHRLELPGSSVPRSSSKAPETDP